MDETKGYSKKPYVVYSFKMMRYLDRLGFKFFECRPNLKEPGKVVFFYNNDPDLRKAAQEFMNKNA